MQVAQVVTLRLRLLVRCHLIPLVVVLASQLVVLPVDHLVISLSQLVHLWEILLVVLILLLAIVKLDLVVMSLLAVVQVHHQQVVH